MPAISPMGLGSGAAICHWVCAAAGAATASAAVIGQRPDLPIAMVKLLATNGPAGSPLRVRMKVKRARDVRRCNNADNTNNSSGRRSVRERQRDADPARAGEDQVDA